MLDHSIPYLLIVSEESQKNNKDRTPFLETNPFDTPLPFIPLFFIRPPYSNLLMSPEINVRHVACDSFGVVPDGQDSSLRDIIYSGARSAKTTFRSRQIILYPYKITRKAQAGIPVKSVSCYKIQHEGKTLEYILVELENAAALNISKEDFKRLMVLFGCRIDGRSDVYNFMDLFNI
jgi:hypothetical protein